MNFQDYFPIWNKLTSAQQNRIMTALMTKHSARWDLSS